jgi:hypothetical protein
MTEETKRRVLERVEQILAAQDSPLKTINDLEHIALTVRDEVAKATLEEAAKQIKQDQTDEAQSQEAKPETQTARVAYKLPCRHCKKNAYFKGLKSKNVQTLAGWVTLKRAYYHCQRCHHGFCPEDFEQQVAGHMTLRLAQEIAALGSGNSCPLRLYALRFSLADTGTPYSYSSQWTHRPTPL